jgi:hypothetical protein
MSTTHDVAVPAEMRDYMQGMDTAFKEIAAFIANEVQHAEVPDVNTLAPRLAARITSDFTTKVYRASEAMPTAVLSVYTPTVRALEREVERATSTALTEELRFAVSNRVFHDLRAQPTFVRAVEELIRGGRNGPAWEEWGRASVMSRAEKKKDSTPPPPPYEIPFDRQHVRETLEAAAVRALVERVHVAATAKSSSREYATARQRDAATARDAAEQAAHEFARVTLVLVEVSARETSSVLPRYTAALARLLEDLPSAYAEMLRTVTSKDALQAAYAAELVARLDAASAVFESYRREAPLVAVDQRVPEAPTKRTLAMLLQTAPGAEFASLYEASRRVVPTARAPFLTELPHNLVDVDILSNAPEPSRHPMDRVNRYFQSRAFGDDGRRMDEEYERLDAKTEKKRAPAA